MTFTRASRRGRQCVIVAFAAGLLGLAATVACARPSARAGAASQITVDEGTAPDGSRYKWVIYDRTFSATVGLKGFGSRLYCLALRFRAKPRRGTGAFCESYEGKRLYANSLIPIRSLGAQFLKSSTGRRPDVMVSGTTDPRVARVRVIYTDSAGSSQDVPVDFARFQGERVKAAHKALRAAARRAARKSGKRVHRSSGSIRPFNTYVAFVPGDWAARDGLAARERRLRGNDPSLPPGGGVVDLSDLTHQFMLSRCSGGPTGPFRLIAYDGGDRQLDDMPDEVCRRRGR